MTKCIVIGEKKETEKLKPIELIYLLNNYGLFAKSITDASNYKNLELITKGRYKYDIIFAYDDDRNSGILYLGHWNDGIV